MIKNIDRTKETINNSINNLQEIPIDDIKDIIVDLRKN
jgi:hypothetical protein